MRKPLLTTLGITAATILLFSGCSTSGGDKKTQEDSPLASYFSKINEGFDQKEIDKQQKQIEDLVATCMSDEGFDYTPSTNSMTVMGDTDFYKGMGTLEWAEKNGYGFTTSPQNETPPDEQPVNPNDEYVASLSETEQSAYNTALYGEQVEPTEEPEDEGSSNAVEYDWKTAGCYGKASHEVQSDTNPYEDPEYKDLFDEMNSLYEKTAKDPEVVKTQKEWSNCMADANYPNLKESSDAQNLVNEKQSEVYGWNDAPTDGAEDWTPPEPTQKQKDELKQYEIDLAVADFTCGEKTKSAQTMLDVQFKLENEFISKNKTKLDAMIAKFEKK